MGRMQESTYLQLRLDVVTFPSAHTISWVSSIPVGCTLVQVLHPYWLGNLLANQKLFVSILQLDILAITQLQPIYTSTILY